MKFLVTIAYIAMVVVNFLANRLPINNRSTGDISDAYPNLFAPAGLTFAIWGLIYLSLLGYVIYQFTRKEQGVEALLKKINPLFLGTSLANIAWIFAWHYDYIGLSVLLMIVLLVLLIRIADVLRGQSLGFLQKLFCWLPFSLYFGWITVALIANVTVFLVSTGWGGFGVPEYMWTNVVLVVGAVIGSFRIWKDSNVAYGLVLIWAYSGIVLKHISDGGFDGQYPSIVLTALACLGLYLILVARIALSKKP